MPTLRYWDAVAGAWTPLPVRSSPEVHVGTSAPAYRGNMSLWLDTDDTIPHTQIDAFEISGPYTSAGWVTRVLSWKADVLVVWSATCFSTVGAFNGCALAVDGSAKSHAGYYFNQVHSHKQVSATVLLPAMTPGPHTWGIYNEYYATADGNDRAHISLVAKPVIE